MIYLPLVGLTGVFSLSETLKEINVHLLTYSAVKKCGPHRLFCDYSKKSHESLTALLWIKLMGDVDK